MTNLTKSTKPVKEKEIKRDWYLFDAGKHVLGRLATQVATTLVGKHKSDYVNYLDMGDNVVVINAKSVLVTGDKDKTKIYSRYSGYPGGLKKVTLSEVRQRRPGEIIRHAVYGMLPKNKLRDRRIARLHIFSDNKHTFEIELKDHGKKNI